MDKESKTLKSESEPEFTDEASIHESGSITIEDSTQTIKYSKSIPEKSGVAAQEKTDAGVQQVVEVVQEAEKDAETARGERDKTDAGVQQVVEVVQEAEKDAETARGERDEKTDAGDQQVVEVVQEAEKDAETARLEMDEKTDARDQQVVELVEESAKSVLGEPDEEVGGAMKKPDDVSVAFGGARPKIKPRNTLDYGGGVMEKTKPKKKRRNKDRKHHERQFSDKEMMEMMENLPAVPTDIDIRSSSDNLDSARDGLPSRARFASDATPKTRTEEDSIISELGGVADLTDSVVLNIPEDSLINERGAVANLPGSVIFNIPEDSLINERGAVANLPEPIISEDDSSINKLGPVANLLEPVEVIVPENPLPPFVPDDNDEWEEPDYGNRPFRTFAINGRYRAGESLALERDNHWNNRECCILGMWIAVGATLFGLLVFLLTRKQMEDLENAAEEYKNATEEYKNATKESKD